MVERVHRPPRDRFICPYIFLKLNDYILFQLNQSNIIFTCSHKRLYFNQLNRGNIILHDCVCVCARTSCVRVYNISFDFLLRYIIRYISKS